MKALSILQPWAWACAAGHKPLENRSWCLPSRMAGQRIAIHAGKGKSEMDDLGAHLLMMEQGLQVPADEELTFGAIIGYATLGACVHASESPWFFGPHAFELRDARLLATPIPFRGQLGFFDVPDEVSNG